jgi:hypothetical protein
MKERGIKWRVGREYGTPGIFVGSSVVLDVSEPEPIVPASNSY